MSGSRIALTHASSQLAEAIIEVMVESGISPDSVVLLDDPDSAPARLRFGDTYLTPQDQYACDYEGLSAVLLLQPDDELQDLLQHAACYVLTHVGDGQPARFFNAGDALSQLPEEPGWVRLAGAEISTLASVLGPLRQLSEIVTVGLVNVRSASMFGKPAIEELASQTVSLLNSREAQPSAFALPLAFNMIPGVAHADQVSQLRALLDNPDLRCSIQEIVVAAFHGLAQAVSLEFAGPISTEAARQQLAGYPGIRISDQPVSPHSHCRDGHDLYIFDLAEEQNHPNRLQFWIIADGIRNGLVKNYQNTIQVLPNFVV